ncbi:MAG: hypothetical protein JXA97_12955 [Anaerolineales bacterium]|nr:hypothetical protein [Anaerolineales bacterium]
MQGAYVHAEQIKSNNELHPLRIPHVLLLEYEIHLRKVASLSLQQAGMDVLAAASADEAFSLMNEQAFQLLIVSVDCEDDDLDALLDDFRRRGRHQAAPLIVITGERINTDWRSRHKPDKTIYKPYDIRHLCRAARSLARPDEGKYTG